MSQTPNQRVGNAHVVKSVSTTISGTTPATIWTPASGHTVRLRGCALRANVLVVLAGATPGDHIFLCDNANTTPLLSIGGIVSATDAPGITYGHTYFNMDIGWPLAAADNVLKIATTNTIGVGGIIVIRGYVWGDEVR